MNPSTDISSNLGWLALALIAFGVGCIAWAYRSGDLGDK